MWLEWDDESSSKGKLFPKLPIFAPSFMLKTVAAMAWQFFSSAVQILNKPTRSDKYGSVPSARCKLVLYHLVAYGNDFL